MDASCFASSTGLTRYGTFSTVARSSTRSVRAAATARATSGSRLSYTSRSRTLTEAKPARSLASAQSPRALAVAPGTAAGNPIPILMTLTMPKARRLRHRVSELLGLRRPDRPPRPPQRPRHHVRGRFTGAVRQYRAVQAARGLDVPLVLVGRKWEEPEGRATGLGTSAGGVGVRYHDEYDT